MDAIAQRGDPALVDKIYTALDGENDIVQLYGCGYNRKTHEFAKTPFEKAPMKRVCNKEVRYAMDLCRACCLWKVAVRWLVLLATLGLNAHAGEREFGGSFQELRPEQQRLVVDTVSRFNSSTGQSLIPQQVYDGARVSR